MRKVFVTGISGLLGTHLANALLEQGNHVYAIVRDPKRYTGKKSPNLELVRMDLWGEYGPYLDGVDAVVHIAAETSTNLIRYADYDRTNFQATVRVFELAKAHQVKRFIFISTANTIGYGNQHDPGTECRAIGHPFSGLPYAQSKLKAENYLLSHQEGIQLSILNPTFIIGAHDGKPSSRRILMMSLGKRVVFFPPGGKNFVGVQDVVQAILQACHRRHASTQYLIAGENMSYHAFFKLLGHITGQKQILIRIPKTVLTTLGLIGDLIRFTGIKTNLSSPNMRVLSEYTYYSNQKSVTELGMGYTPLAEALETTVRQWPGRKHKRSLR